MKCWVFNEEQLKAALGAWTKEKNAHESGDEMLAMSQKIAAVDEFLNSHAARENKLTMVTKS